MIENKPITLMTGAPGSGKTALIVKFIDEAVKQGRPVFQMGIPELKLPHFPTPPIEEWTEQRQDPDHPSMMLPYFTFPERSLVILSEAQRVYRPRANGSKIPDHVAAFETVRHTGVTFIFDTQHPDFIDSHVRKLVGQHIHLIDFGFLGRRHYEWPYCGKPDEFKSAPIKKKYRLPKEIFGLYKSSSLHIKRNYTLPPAFVVLAICFVLLLSGGWYLYSSFQKKIAPATTSQAQKPPAQQEVAQAVNSSDPEALLSEFVPRLRYRPESAPAYDQLRQVKTMPVVVGCVATAARCRCVNQQGTDAGLDDMQCRDWLLNPPFNPYLDQPPVQAGESRQLPEQAGGSRARPSGTAPSIAASIAPDSPSAPL